MKSLQLFIFIFQYIEVPLRMTADQYSQYQRYIAGMTEEQRAAYDLQLVQYYQKWHIPRSRSGTLVSGQTVRINYKT